MILNGNKHTTQLLLDSLNYLYLNIVKVEGVQINKYAVQKVVNRCIYNRIIVNCFIKI